MLTLTRQSQEEKKVSIKWLISLNTFFVQSSKRIVQKNDDLAHNTLFLLLNFRLTRENESIWKSLQAERFFFQHKFNLNLKWKHSTEFSMQTKIKLNLAQMCGATHLKRIIFIDNP